MYIYIVLPPCPPSPRCRPLPPPSPALVPRNLPLPPPALSFCTRTLSTGYTTGSSREIETTVCDPASQFLSNISRRA